jgi:cytochrome c oxidase cbb3-type subunit III
MSHRGWLLFGLVIAAVGCKAERVPLDTEMHGLEEPTTVLLTPLQAGPARARADVQNPFAGSAHAIQRGKRFYEWFNCAGCHGALGGGAMGPPLADTDWIYGGRLENIRDSILKGRPNGMPAYAGRLSDDAVWQIIAFLQSFGGIPGALEIAPGTPAAGGGEEAEPDEGGGERAAR